MKIIGNCRGLTRIFDYLIADETGTYGVAFRDNDCSFSDYCTCLLEPDFGAPIADTSKTQEWPEFYQRGWTKSELCQGWRDAWNLPTGAEAEAKFGGEIEP